MTTQKMLKEIQNKIFPPIANPEPEELKPGCYVLAALFKDGEVVDDRPFQSFIFSEYDSAKKDPNGLIYINHCLEEYEFYSFLDRPITLEHVLKITSEKWRTSYGTNPVDGRKHVNVFGGGRVLREGEVLYSLCSKWTLGHPLSSQREETISFIYKLLK